MFEATRVLEIGTELILVNYKKPQVKYSRTSRKYDRNYMSEHRLDLNDFNSPYTTPQKKAIVKYKVESLLQELLSPKWIKRKNRFSIYMVEDKQLLSHILDYLSNLDVINYLHVAYSNIEQKDQFLMISNKPITSQIFTSTINLNVYTSMPYCLNDRSIIYFFYDSLRIEGIRDIKYR